MAPAAGGKRKRGDRSWSGDHGNDGQRPSPHRPGNLNMAQHNQPPSSPQTRDYPDTRGRGRRQSNRGGRNGVGRRLSDTQNQPGSSEKAMSPPGATPAKEAPEPAQANGPSTTNQASPSPAPSTQPPTQTQSQPAPADASQAPPGPPLPYHYEHVIDSAVEEWASAGKPKLIEDAVDAKNKEDVVKLSSIYQELIQSALHGRLSPPEAGSTVKEIIGGDVASQDVDMDGDGQTSISPLDPRSLFLDTLSIVTDSDPSNNALKPLVFSTEINPALMRLQLETPLLQSLGLVRETFTRIGIRKQTNLLYRQSNYNLLREESEGYSKLLTELFTTSNNEPPSSEVVEDTFERVKAMIGAFDMDVGRVLDVTLDVFAAVLVKQYRFFVKLLRASSWWPKDDIFRNVDGSSRDSGLPNWALPGSAGWVTTDEERGEIMRSNEQRDSEFWDRVRQIGMRAFFEIGRKPVSEEERKQILPDHGFSEEEDSIRKWIDETGTLPPKGNRVAAQLLGFKLRFYSSKARDKSDVLPDNLIYLAALLIKVGFISLRDLYSHLWRPDDSMDVLKEEKMKEKVDREKAARPGGGMNALLAAGALPDDTMPMPRLRDVDARSTPGKEQDSEKSAAAKAEEELPEPSDQKVLLLKSLLVIGAVPESLYILSKFPWLLETYPELPEFIHRILHHCLSKVFSSLPSESADDCQGQRQMPNHDQSGMGKGHVRLALAPPRRVLRWALLDKEDTNDGTDYRFYWDDWADNIPVCQSVDDVFALCSSFLNLSGYKIGQDPSLLMKIARIGKDSLNNDSSEENKSRWRDLSKRLLVPSISLTKANPGVVNEIYDLISFYPREVRYNIYAEWNSGQISRLPDIKAAFDQARSETKDVLKRLSKTNIRPMARALARIAYANPGIVISVAISQIESYENLIEVVVECARYFTYLGYDILTWSLINSLGQKGRSRVQEGGLLTSRWLNALSTFAGRIFKRYSVMDPTPLLQYVVDQLQHNNSTDLIVLEQMISSMAGIITDTNFNDLQIQAMAGGQVLQSQTILQLLDKRHESKTTSRRLMKSLTVSKLAGQLLVAIAQERLTCIFKESDEASSELKLLGNIFDEIHRVLTQYLDLLRSNLSVDEFDSFVPDLTSLIKEFGIQPEMAFWIRRQSVSQRISDYEESKQAEEPTAKDQESEATAKGEDEKMEPVDDEETTGKEDEQPTEGAMDVDKEQGKPAEVNGVISADQSSSSGPATVEGPSSNPVIQEMEEQVKSVLPPDCWEVVGIHFYVIFWQLSLYDVHVPQKAYEDEIERQKKKVIAIGNDRSDISVAGSQRKERDKKQVTQLQEQIIEENKNHLTSYGQMRTKLQKEKDRWFAGMRGKHDSLNIALLEQCFLPRLLLSPIEAFYCFKLLKFLHTSGTPNFRTVGLLDQLFREQRLTALIFQCTSKEADNLGRFLNEILRDLSRWHGDKAIYEKEAFGTKRDFPGFAMAVDPEGKPSTFLEYEDFRRLLYKWHRVIASSLKTCLNGGEYMHIRNAISVLKAVVQHFPAVNWIGRDMLTSVNNLSQKDERDDVKTPAASLIGDLNRREKKWMLPQAFMINQPIPADKAAAAKSKSPQPPATSTQLNATAPDFKPPAGNDTEGTPKPGEPTKAEVEDGEIEDAKMTDVTKVEEKPEKPAELAEIALQSGESSTTEAPTASASQTQPETGRESVTEEKAAATTPEVRAEAEPTPTQATPSSISRSSSRAGERGRHGNVPDRPEPERPSPSTSTLRPEPHLPNRPPRNADARLPARPSAMHDRRDRHRDSPRGGRYGDHDPNRSFDQQGRLDRELPARPMPDEQFRSPSYRDGRTPREQPWPERSGRLRPSESFHGRSEPDRGVREGPAGQRSGPSTHPDRVDLIHDRPDRPGDGHRRPDKDDRRPVPSALSPPRADLPNRPERFPPNDRRAADAPPAQPRRDEPPTGPRSDRPSRGTAEAPSSRESMPAPDMTHGRLRQPDPPADTPSGPKGRPGRGGRSMSGSQHPPQSPFAASPSVEHQPPTGPGRQGMRSSVEQSPSAASSPQTTDTSGIHPDRLKVMQQQSNGGGYGGGRTQQPSGPPPIAPPSGPRSAQPSAGPSPVSRAPPSGPLSGGERGRGDKRFAGINNMLQQSGGPGPGDRGPGTTIRGRGASRAMNAPSPQVPGPPTPTGTTEAGRPTQRAQGRPELMAGRSSGPNSDVENAGRSRRGRTELLDAPASDARRSSRHSSSTSHPHDRERERERERDRDRERDRRGDDEGGRSSRREEYRERPRDFERERSRRSEGGANTAREERHESRETSRRAGGLREETRRRDRRERDDGPEAAEQEGRLRPPSSLGGGPPPPPPPPFPPSSSQDERRWGGGHEARNRDREHMRMRDRDYSRDSAPRKRGRTGGEEGQEGGRGGRTGTGNSENKRPRRGA